MGGRRSERRVPGMEALGACFRGQREPARPTWASNCGSISTDRTARRCACRAFGKVGVDGRCTLPLAAPGRGAWSSSGNQSTHGAPDGLSGCLEIHDYERENRERSSRRALDYWLAQQERLWDHAKPVTAGEPRYGTLGDSVPGDFGARQDDSDVAWRGPLHVPDQGAHDWLVTAQPGPATHY